MLIILIKGFRICRSFVYDYSISINNNCSDSSIYRPVAIIFLVFKVWKQARHCGFLHGHLIGDLRVNLIHRYQHKGGNVLLRCKHLKKKAEKRPFYRSYYHMETIKITSFPYNWRIKVVRYNSDTTIINTGVPQDSVFSPTPFTTYQ